MRKISAIICGAGVALALWPAVAAFPQSSPEPDPATTPAAPFPIPSRKAPPVVDETAEVQHNRRFLEDRVRRDPEDAPALNRLAALDLQLLRITGRFDYLALAATAARQSVAAVPASENGGGLSSLARVQFESHRFAEARDTARQLTTNAPDRADGFLILGDALLELGDIDGALAAWREMARLGDDGIDVEVRLARVALLRGELDKARDGFTRAAELARENDPPAPTTVVWCLLQRGQLAFGRGDWDGAEKDYFEAQSLVPDHFATQEHLAELRGAQRRFPEAIALYEDVIKKTDRPEFIQALGDLYAFAGRGDEAKSCHARALAGYLKSVDEGNAHYFHHLAGFYCDVQTDPAEALKWARRDIDMRQSVYAYDTLAWALYQNGQWPAAADAVRKAMATGIRDAHLLYHAGMILSRSGDLAAGGKLLREVSAANPHYFNTFHVHR